MTFGYIIETDDYCKIRDLSQHVCRHIEVSAGSRTFRINGRDYHTLVIDAEFERPIPPEDLDGYNSMDGVSIMEKRPATA